MEALRVPARLEALASIGGYVLKAAEQAGIDKRAAYRLRLAVDEIATNIIMHGQPDHQGNDAIALTADVDDRTLTITLEDPGPPYNPIGKEKPAGFDRPMEERRMGGLGVFLAIRGVDRFHYERVGTLNRNIFVVHRAAPTPAEAR